MCILIGQYILVLGSCSVISIFWKKEKKDSRMKVIKLGGKKDNLMYTNLTLLFPRRDSRSLWAPLWDPLRVKGNHSTIFHLKGKGSKCDLQTSGSSSSAWSAFLNPTEPESSFPFVCTVKYETQLPTGLYLCGSLSCFSERSPPASLPPPHKCRSSSITG